MLIASSRIGTGVNGLQYVCNKLIINCLPWTNAEYEQLVGRLYRQGSKFTKVRVVIPVTFAMVGGERWSYCESKLHRLEYKKSIADAAVDGVVPALGAGRARRRRLRLRRGAHRGSRLRPDYVREAHRCLRLDGWLHIWEPASYFDDVTKFCAKLSRLGFDVMAPQTEGAFVGIYAVRNAKKSDPKLDLPFRGHGQ